MRKSIAETTKIHSILTVKFSTRMKQFADFCSMAFDKAESNTHGDRIEQIRALYEVIGKQQVQLDFLK